MLHPYFRAPVSLRPQEPTLCTDGASVGRCGGARLYLICDGGLALTHRHMERAPSRLLALALALVIVAADLMTCATAAPESSGDAVTLFIAVVSRSASSALRDAARGTWAAAAALPPRVAYRFFVGRFPADLRAQLEAERARHGDIIELTELANETYATLTRKTLYTVRWAVAAFRGRGGFSWLMKCDDDSLVDVPVLLADLVKHSAATPTYWGFQWTGATVCRDRTDKNADPDLEFEVYPPYMSGSGYVLSRGIADYLADPPAPLRLLHNEDTAVGFWLEKAPLRVTRIHDERFHWSRFASILEACRPGTLVLQHHIKPNEFRVCWGLLQPELNTAEPRNLVEGFVQISASAACEANKNGVQRDAYDESMLSLDACKVACAVRGNCAAIDWYNATHWCNFYTQACTHPTAEHDGASSYRLTERKAPAVHVKEDVAGANTSLKGAPQGHDPMHQRSIWDKQEMSGDRRGISGDRRQISGDKREISGGKREISGDKREISGDRRGISGDKREISGDRRGISMHKREISGDRRDCTLVSAYFYRASHPSAELHDKWMANTLSLRDPMVVFTAADQVHKIWSMRRHAQANTEVVSVDLRQTYMARTFTELHGGPRFWEAQSRADTARQRHNGTVHVYWIWNERANWLRQVAERNPFRSRFFAWVDIGYLRTTQFKHQTLVRWVPASLQPNQVLMLNGRDSHLQRPSVGGGFIGGFEGGVLRWFRSFYETLAAAANAGEFIGKAEVVMTRTCERIAGLCLLIVPEGVGDPWVYMAQVVHQHPYAIRNHNSMANSIGRES